MTSRMGLDRSFWPLKQTLKHPPREAYSELVRPPVPLPTPGQELTRPAETLLKIF